MTEPLNISRPFDTIFAGDPYDPTPTTFPDEPNPTRPTTGAGPAPPAPTESPSPTVRQLVQSHSDSRPTSWYVAKFKSELACALPRKLALRSAELDMAAGGLARRMMDHFLSGSSAPFRVDLNVELERNPQLREYVASRIAAALSVKSLYGEPVEDMNGSVWVPQQAYGNTPAGHDQQYALGGTYFEFQVVGTAPGGRLEVTVNVADHYFWSPSEPERPTHCLHVYGDSLVLEGKATEFYQFGEGSLVVDDPRAAPTSNVLEVEAQDDL